MGADRGRFVDCICPTAWKVLLGLIQRAFVLGRARFAFWHSGRTCLYWAVSGRTNWFWSLWTQTPRPKPTIRCPILTIYCAGTAQRGGGPGRERETLSLTQKPNQRHKVINCPSDPLHHYPD
ncbi:hypothetical protein XENTR_v10022994 [Xenopus tropicalis]|nr:hypothetical protein XENTR_v10022994 [Xenopus tropicalis]